MKVYISGKITGEENGNGPNGLKYQEKFKAVQTYLESHGFIVMNPAVLPWGFDYNDYIPINFKMIDCCDAIVLLRDWERSKGARIERVYADKHKKQIIYFDALICQDAMSQLRELRAESQLEMLEDRIDPFSVATRDYLALDWAIGQLDHIVGNPMPNNKPDCFTREGLKIYCCTESQDEYCQMCDLNGVWTTEETLMRD